MVETDASVLGLGAVLSQKQPDNHVLLQPIANASRNLHTHEKNYGITEFVGSEVVQDLLGGSQDSGIHRSFCLYQSP